VFHGPIRERLVLTKILLAPGGERLSGEAAQIIAVLAMEKRPYYVGDRNEPREFPRESAQGIVKSLSHCHHVTQGLIREKDQIQRSLGWMTLAVKALAVVNAFLTVVAGTLALLKFL
jgi:hypothetical protein